MNIIDQIKAEIERLKGQLIRGACAAQIEMETSCKDEAYNEMLSILSDLEKEEKPIEGLEEEIERYLHSLGVGYGGWVDGMEDDDLRGIARHFAQWQKVKLMKEAVEVDTSMAEYNDADFKSYLWNILMMKGAIDGQKVKIIIVKEDDK